MASSFKIVIGKEHKLYRYCDRLTAAGARLWNAALFRIICGMSMYGKKEKELSENETLMLRELAAAAPQLAEGMGARRSPELFLDPEFVVRYLAAVNCREYTFPMLPRKSAGYIVNEAVAAARKYCRALAFFQVTKSEIFSLIRPVRFRDRGRRRSVTIHRDDCALVLSPDKEGDAAFTLCLPLAKLKRRCGISGLEGLAPLTQAVVSPKCGKNAGFVITLCFGGTEGRKKPHAQATQIVDCRPDAGAAAANEAPAADWNAEAPNATRVCAIDTGTINIAAVTNNVGAPCLLFRKEILAPALPGMKDKTAHMEGSHPANKPGISILDEEAVAALLRDATLDQLLDETAARIAAWCSSMEIGTIFTGTPSAHNKSEMRFDIKNDASFYQIISPALLGRIREKASAAGIQVVALDESYTSLASFLDGDAIPAANSNLINARFSGKRVRHNRYRSAAGVYINADLNASANIARKGFPDAFAGDHAKPDFDNVVVITDPFVQKL